MKDFFAEADDLLKKLAWVERATAIDVVLRSSQEEYVERLNELKKYETYQFTINQFRNVLAVRLSRAYESGKQDVQLKIKEALDIREA